MFSITSTNLIFTNILIIIAVEVSSTPNPIEKLSLGDIIDKENFETSAAVFGNIINSNEKIPFIVKFLTESIGNPPKWSIAESACSKNLNSHNDPADETNLFEIFDKRKLNYKLFEIDEKYLNNNHTCVLFELCKFEKKIYREFVHLFDEKLFQKYNDDFYYFDQERNRKKHVDILKFSRGNQTHFVSAVTTGDCLFQVFVFDAETKETSDNSIDFSKETPQLSSKIIMTSNNHSLEKKATEYLNSFDFLFNFPNFPSKIQSEILNYLAAGNIMSVELTALPKLPRSLEPEEVKVSKNRSSLMGLQPGDSFNVDDLTSNSVLTNGNILEFMVFKEIDYEYLHDYQVNNYSGVKMEKSSLPCRKFATKHLSNDNKENIEKLNPFDCLLEENSYGVDLEFFRENYRRDEIKVCLILKEQKLAINPTEVVVSLSEKSIYSDYNVFENENIMVRFPKGNETHYVSSIKFGDCLYQALVFNSSGNSDKRPVHRGKILSASRDSRLEQTIEDYLNSDSRSDKSLFQIYHNETLRNEIIEKLEKKAVLNLSFRSISEKRPLPLPDRSEYQSFRNSTQNLPIKNSQVLSQELMAAVLQNFTQPNEAFMAFAETLITALFKNLTQDLFSNQNLSNSRIEENPGKPSPESVPESDPILSDPTIETRKNSSQDLGIDAGRNNSSAKKLKTNSSSSLRLSFLNMTFNLIIFYLLLVS